MTTVETDGALPTSSGNAPGSPTDGLPPLLPREDSGKKLKVTNTRVMRSDSRATTSSRSTTITNGTQGDSRSLSTQGGPFGRSVSTNSQQHGRFSGLAVNVRVDSVLVRKATDSGAASPAHPGCWAELRILRYGMYIGQRLPDDVLVPPLRLFGYPLCVVSFKDVKVVVEHANQDSLLLTLRHRTSGEKERLLLGMALGNSTVTSPVSLASTQCGGSGFGGGTEPLFAGQSVVDVWTASEALAAIVRSIEAVQDGSSVPSLRSP